MRRNTQSLILTIFALYFGSPPTLWSLSISHPNPSTLLGRFTPIAYESPETRLERQAAENHLLVYFGLNQAGFAPYATRHPQSMFPLIYEAAQIRLGDEPSAGQIEQLLELLLRDAKARAAFAPYLVGVALKALQIPPDQYDAYPAAKSLQEQFAVYYTNERRNAANRTYEAWSLYKCAKLQGQQDLSGLLTASFVSEKGFQGLKDPLDLGQLGSQTLEAYRQTMRRYVSNAAALTPPEEALLGALTAGLPISDIPALTVATMISGIADAVDTDGKAVASLASGLGGASAAVIARMLASGGMPLAEVFSTLDWEGAIRAEREYTATEDPMALHDALQQALDNKDEVFQGELLSILLKMLIVEPARLAVAHGRDGGHSQSNSPQLSVEKGQKRVGFPNGNPVPYASSAQDRMIQSDGEVSMPDLDRSPLEPRSIGRMQDALDPQEASLGCEAPPPPQTPFAALPDFKALYNGTIAPPYRSLLGQVAAAAPQASQPQGEWRSLERSANDVAIGADGTVWHIGTLDTTFGHPIYRRSGLGWEQIAGEAIRIAVGSEQHVAAINKANQILRWTAGGWQKLPGLARDIGIAHDGSMWVIGALPAPGGFEIYRWDANDWVPVTGGAVRIDVGANDQAVVANDLGETLRWTGSAWMAMPGLAFDVAVGADGSIWKLGYEEVLPGGHRPYRWTGLDWQEYPGLGAHISARDGRRLVLSDSKHALFEGDFLDKPIAWRTFGPLSTQSR